MDPTPQSASQSSAELNGILKAYYPQIQQLVSQGQTTAAQGGLAADQSVSPGYAQLASDLYKQYAPQNAQTGVQVAGINQLGQTQNAVNTATGPGSQLVGLADRFQRQLDPNAYATQDAVGKANLALLGSMDPTKLSGSEAAEVQRGIGQNPANLTPSALTTVSNAMTFGHELQNKQARFGDAISRVSGTIPSLRSGINGLGTALGAPMQQNTGNNVNTSPTYNAGQSAYNLFNTAAGTFGQSASNAQKQQQSWMSQLGGITNAVGGAAGSVGGILSAI